MLRCTIDPSCPRHVRADPLRLGQISTSSISNASSSPRGSVEMQRRTARLVERRGSEADVVPTGAAVLAALETTDYARILMDCDMREMDGDEATRRIRVHRSWARRYRSSRSLPM